MKYLTGSVLALGLTLLSNLANSAVVVNYEAGTLNTVSAISAYNTSGSDMNGMQVTALFGDGSSDILFWADTGVNSGGVSGSDWSLSFSGYTTFSTSWVLSYTGSSYIDSLFIDAGLGDTVFDTRLNSFGTAMSYRGADFSATNDLGGLDIAATYSDAVALNGNAPVGDLYRNLSLDFSMAGRASGGFTGELTFRADTDNVIGPMVTVPEPSPLALLLLAAIGFTYSRAKR